VKNLLYYVARSKANSRYIKEIKAGYKLEASLLGEGELEDSDLATPDSAAMQAVVVALAKELSEIQQQMQIAGSDSEALSEVVPLFRRVCDTLAILGLGKYLKQLQELYSRFAKQLATDIDDEEITSILAGVSTICLALNPEELIELEQAAELFNNSEEAQQHLDNAFDSVFRESRVGLEQAKDAVIEFVANQWDHTCLTDMPGQLQVVIGSLAMVPLVRASQILKSCETYVSQDLIANQSVPDWQVLDTLADARTSVDYYLERLAEDPESDGGAILDMAAESVAELGYPVVADEGVEPPLLEQQEVTAGIEPPVLAEVASLVSGVEKKGNEDSVTELSAEDIPVLAQTIDTEYLNVSDVEIVFDGDSNEAVELGELIEAEPEFQVQPVTEDNDCDPEIAEIFIEEAGEVLETIAEYLPQLHEDHHNNDARATVRRAFHTLKGSGRMVGATDISDLAWSIENLLNKIIEGGAPLAEKQLQLVAEVADYVPAMVSAFENRQPLDKTVANSLIAKAEGMAAGDAGSEEGVDREQNSKFVTATEVPTLSATEGLEFERVVPELEEVFVLDDIVALDGINEDSSEEIDYELLEIFQGEAITHKDVLDEFVAHCYELAGPADLTDDLQRALHTLKGSANMAAIIPVAMVVGPVEGLVKDLRAMQMKADQPIVEILERTSVFIQQGADQLTTAPMQVLPGTEEFLDALAVLHKERLAVAADANAGDSAIPPEALNEFLTLSLDVICDASDLLPAWKMAEITEAQQQGILESFGNMIDKGELINMSAFIELAQAMQIFYRQAIQAGESGEPFIELAAKSNDALIDMLDQVAGHQTPSYEQALLVEVEEFAMQAFQAGETVQHGQEGISEQELDAAPEVIAELVDAITEVDVASELEVDLENFEATEDTGLSGVINALAEGELLVDESEALSGLMDQAEDENIEQPMTVIEQPVDHLDEDDEELDAEIIEIFTEEADELLELLDEAIHAWDSDRANRKHPDEMLRVLHTLKGGARLGRLTAIGDLSHDFESRLESIDLENLQADDQILAESLTCQDELIGLLEQLKQSAAPSEKDHVADVSAQQSFVQQEEPLKHSEKPQAKSVDNIEEFKPLVVPVIPEKEIAPFTAVAGTTDEVNPLAADNKRGPQEVVKVSATLLEELVNLAGETSISRGRAEEQISELVFSLDEMQITVDRLQQQVRRLDMETEQQILHRQEQVEIEGLEGFDPLEMDRYSQLQTLSRSLLESSSDLSDIKGTLADKARDMETLLVQQSRINTELQEGLMRSRMVPFSRMVPRLRRIVRQISGELDKKVDFKLNNVEGELDRTVLERMVAPIEHMLRNAVDHGIEDKVRRDASGKPPRGTVSLNLAREGGEIVLTLTDDGAGIDLEMVKKKAIERGLMEADANLSNHEILQFILQAGFSTAEKVTQISGRGVGMDVVHSEIKQLGGTMDIESILGQGTRFIVRLPFTVSVNRALMVSVGGDNYAIPLNTIEGIVRVSPFELEAYYQPDAPMFEYAGQSYSLRYMGVLLNRGEKQNFEGRSMPLPVILVRGADHSVAIQVDHLMGSREIVVKPLGPQFSMVQGLSGATVLGDGNVVIILDLPAMIRADVSHAHRGLLAHQDDVNEEVESTLVMVVDDSVTVRKVTSRFLERQGMEVILAKDGVDAIAQLSEMDRLPSVMLLDIEMPRMDGFEVASRVRHTSRLNNIPIIMITSRTGEKHRERAMSLGVNHYMGKPYQENMLLEAIQELTGNTIDN
jgi:chemosensory pili system protein ChpA (sensor histidine kinase/response regulator)